MPVVNGFTSMMITVLPGSSGREDPQIGEVQARVIAGELQVGRAVVVGHARSLLDDPPLRVVGRVGDYYRYWQLRYR